MAHTALRATAVLAMGLMASACPDDLVPLGTEASSGGSGTTMASTTMPTTVVADSSSGALDTTAGGGSSSTGPSAGSSSTGPAVSSSEGSSSEGSSSGGSSSGGSSSGGGSSSSSGGDDYQFAPNPPGDYTTHDRAGFAATSTAMVLLGNKDLYNQSSPTDDAALAFLADYNDSLNTWHRGAPGLQTPNNTGLDDDLLAVGLLPCVPPQDLVPTCLDQIGPLIVPDVVAIDLTGAAGFPNGRMPADPVMDIILAIMLLDLAFQPVTLFLDLDDDGVAGPSLNPFTNDVAFLGAFPYLAPPH